MPKDSLFPPGPGNFRVVRLTANGAAHSGMLGCIVDLAGYQLALNSLAGSGTMIILGSGTTSGGILRTLSANQAMQVTLLDNAWHLADSPDLTAINAHLSSTANPHNVTKAQVGLGSVDNTADANKPVSSAQQAAIDAAKNRANHTGTQSLATVSGLEAALAAKAPLASPSFTGIPVGPTAAPGTNTTQFATTAFVAAAISGLNLNGASWGSITGLLETQTDLMQMLGDIDAKFDDKVSVTDAVFTGGFTCSATLFVYTSPAAEAHRAALNAHIAPIQRTSPPLNTGSFGKSTLTFSGNIVTPGQISLNGVAIQFVAGPGPYPSYSLVFDQWPYNGTVTPAQAAAFVTNTINRNQEVFACQAVDNGDGTVLVVALVSGPSGNSIATTDNLNVVSWTAATLTGGSIMGTNVTGTPGKVGQDCIVTYDAAWGITQTYTCIRETPVLWKRHLPIQVSDVAGLEAMLAKSPSTDARAFSAAQKAFIRAQIGAAPPTIVLESPLHDSIYRAAAVASAFPDPALNGYYLRKASVNGRWAGFFGTYSMEWNGAAWVIKQGATNLQVATGDFAYPWDAAWHGGSADVAPSGPPIEGPGQVCLCAGSIFIADASKWSALVTSPSPI